MTIVNLYGTREEIKALYNIVNNVSLTDAFAAPVSGDHVRMNSNASRADTLGRLNAAGPQVEVITEFFARDTHTTAPESLGRVC